MTETSARSDLLALLREQRMLLFVGAGLSFDLGYPLWSKYLDVLETDLGLERLRRSWVPKRRDRRPACTGGMDQAIVRARIDGTTTLRISSRRSGRSRSRRTRHSSVRLSGSGFGA